MGVTITIQFTDEEPERTNLEDPEQVFNAIIWLAEHCEWKKVESGSELSYEVSRFAKISDPRLKENPIQPESVD